MSEFNNNIEPRVDGLYKLFISILEKNEAKKAIDKNRVLIDKSIPSDIIKLVDRLVKSNIKIGDLKTGINKFLNVMYKTIERYLYTKPKAGSFLDCCLKNNLVLSNKLREFQPLIKRINESPNDNSLQIRVLELINQIYEYDKYYVIKENILFPLIEKQWKEPDCIKIMWSFHDDIRINIKKIINMLEIKEFNIKEFNKYIGAVYFNMNAILFRDERILFPYIEETISEEILDELFIEAIALGFPYYKPELKIKESKLNKSTKNIDLKSGDLSLDQIVLLFNHLPVDITFVDENNKVKFFSTPKKRIFPRTNSIIGRDVHNCHPPESVHIVEQIIEAFKNGTKNKAEFWINIGKEKILIQYFALRDKNDVYRGVIEVSQEITQIKKIEGEKKLLEWE